MAKSTGPILAAGAITWVNQTLIDEAPNKQSAVQNTIRLGVATGLLAALMSGVEKIAPTFAPALAYTALATVLLVRMGNKPTPLERVLDVVT